MKKLVFASLFLAGFLISCNNNDLHQTNDQLNSSDLIIKAGYECGWGFGSDSITISRLGVKYAYYVPNKSLKPQIAKTRSISSSEWTEISNHVNLPGFVNLKYQSCLICLDGCDEWIFIKKGEVSHKITFGKGRRIDSISSLQTKMAQIRAEFNSSSN